VSSGIPRTEDGTLLTLDPQSLMQRAGYQPLRPGVDILYLHQDGASEASSALLRYQPGAEVPAHQHPGVEHVFVLSGEQWDERGRYPAGTLVINRPGTSHRVWSPGGCLALVVWERPVNFEQPL
jgi:anti-sigma factor ChrR (cupin superfamily)